MKTLGLVVAVWMAVSLALAADIAMPAANAEASFDCRKAGTTTEKTICSDAALTAHDRSLASLYHKLRTQLSVAERDRLQREQRTWLKESRDRCGDAACIGQSYRARTVALRTALQSSPNAIKQVALGVYHSCTLTVGGTLSCRGHNQSGQIGNGKLGEDRARPTRVIAQGATQVATGDSHSCAVAQGALLCWGNNYYATVGNGQSGDGANVARPTRVIARGVRAVSAGRHHSCAVVNDSLWCWGSNQSGQLGRSAHASMVLQPAEIISGGVSGVAVGERHTCAIVHGALQCWGYNYHGQIGNGVSGGHVPEAGRVIPEGVTAVAAGSDHTCAIANGGLYCWGKNSSGEIGTGNGDNVLTPALVIERGVTSIATDSSGIDAHTCAIVDEALHCWGSNFYGQIGNGPPGGNVRSPVKVIESGVTAVSAHGHHTCAVVDGMEQCWRYSVYGEIIPPAPIAATVRASAPALPTANLFTKYLGTFKGSLISTNTEFVITRFFTNKRDEIVGDYTTVPYEGSSTKVESGTLDTCKTFPDSELHCKWHDQHGTGLLVIQFDEQASEFRGMWFDDRRERIPHMLRKYWLEKTSWNGVRQ